MIKNESVVFDESKNEFEYYMFLSKELNSLNMFELKKFFDKDVLFRLKNHKTLSESKGFMGDGSLSFSQEQYSKLAKFYIGHALENVVHDFEGVHTHRVASNCCKKGFRLLDFLAIVERDAIDIYFQTLFTALAAYVKNYEFITYKMHCEISKEIKIILNRSAESDKYNYLDLDFVAENLTQYYQ